MRKGSSRSCQTAEAMLQPRAVYGCVVVHRRSFTSCMACDGVGGLMHRNMWQVLSVVVPCP